MTSARKGRIGFDAHRLAALDGIGVHSRGLLGALLPLLGDRELVLFGVEDRAAARVALPELPASIPLEPGLPAPGEVELFHGPAGRFPRPWTGPGVLAVHDLTVLSHPDCHTLPNRILTLRGLLHALLAGAAFAAVSRASADELETRLGVGGDRVEVVPNAAATAFRPLAAELAAARVRRRFALEPGYLLAVGTLEPRKNLARLVAAWSSLPEELRARHPLVVVGGIGWPVEGQQMERQRREGPWELDVPGVRRLGAVPEDDLVALYAAAVAFAYPSLAEGFGLPVLEAMACGTPVVTSSRSALPEVAGDAAVLVDPEDVGAIAAALARLVADGDLRADLSARGLRRASSYSWEASARQVLALWDRLV